MQKTGLIVAAVIIVILLIGAGLYLMKSSKKPVVTTQVAKTKTAKPQTVNKNAITGTILSLIEGGKTISCTITYPDNKGTGTIYVGSNKKFAGDFNMKGTNNANVVAHMISNGTYVYMWSAAMPMGIKMSLLAAKNATNANSAQTNQNANLNQTVNMQCNPWVVDESKFTVPTNVSFTDMSNLTNPAQPTSVTPQTGTGTGATSASPCDQITNPTAKAACVNALQGK